MKWTRKKAEQAVRFYTGLIERGAPLTVDEKKDLSSASQFLRQVRKRPAFQNPRQSIKAEHADVFIHNPPTKIYGKVLQIKAEKQTGPYKGQKFFHDFKNATAYGLPNGDVLITTRKKV